MRRVTQILLEFATHILARSVFIVLILSAFEMLVIIAGASERRHRDDSTRPTLRRELKITRSLNKITVVLFRRRTRRFSTPPPPSSVSVKRVVSIQRTRDEIESDARRFLQRGFYVAVFYVGNFAPGEVRVA
jgi:hypothetical protein